VITPELRAEIRRLFYAEHFKLGTIATQLGVHYDTVRAAVDTDRFNTRGVARPSAFDPYLAFMTEVLDRYPSLRATRLHEMLVQRGYRGSPIQTRRVVRRLRPKPIAEAFMRLRTLPGEEAQVDWGHFGTITVGRATRPLSAFVMVLSHSRALFALFTLDQTLESFLRGHVEAFNFFGGAPRVLLYDNLKTAVLERAGTAIRFHPRLLELAGHYHFEPRPVAPARGNEKGRVERQIRFLRERFFAARSFRRVEDLNAQFQRWRAEWAHTRPCPGDDALTVAEALERERPLLVTLPQHPFVCEHVRTLKSGKTPYLRFDKNDYSIPHTLVHKPLSLVASHHEVRILDGDQEVARHARSYGRGEVIENPAHIDALANAKAAARSSRGKDRLVSVIPAAQEFLIAAAARGQNLGTTVQQLWRLLDDYGAHLLARAVAEALERRTPTAASVAHVCERLHRRARRLPTAPLAFDDPRLTNLHVKPHNLEDYDALTDTHEHD
jgi:transposase